MNKLAIQPPSLLRNPHVQSVLASSRLRKLAARRIAANLVRDAKELILDGGDGVRLQGFLTMQNALPVSRGLAVLLHGWEGTVQSNYVLHTGGRLLREGFDVFRLHFRDHGETQALNPGIFHSCLLDEVIRAIADLSRRLPDRDLYLAGYSLGGNFTLRVALRAPEAGLSLRHAAAVCPVIDPRNGLQAIETAPWFYQQYFMLKWADSLRRKQAAYPDRFAFTSAELRTSVRQLTQMLVERYTEFGTLEDYLDGYSIEGDRLAHATVPLSILTSTDDPIVPVGDFEKLTLPPGARLDIAPFGGHCGFITDFRLNGLAENWIAERFRDASDTRPQPNA